MTTTNDESFTSALRHEKIGVCHRCGRYRAVQEDQAGDKVYYCVPVWKDTVDKCKQREEAFLRNHPTRKPKGV